MTNTDFYQRILDIARKVKEGHGFNAFFNNIEDVIEAMEALINKRN